jgi:hypothetical protein
MVSEAVLLPVDVGLKDTPRSHVTPTAMEEPQALRNTNWLALVPPKATLVNDTATVPVLVSFTRVSEPVAPTMTAENGIELVSLE